MGKEQLNRFILRGEVIKLYRQCLKAAHKAPPHARGMHSAWRAKAWHGLCHIVRCSPAAIARMSADGVSAHIKHAFCVQREKQDLYEIKYALSDGREQLKKLMETMSLSVTSS
jgi:hypothetical protein